MSQTMRLLFLGDVALSGLPPEAWDAPHPIYPGKAGRICFNLEIPAAETLNPEPRLSGERLNGCAQAGETLWRWAPAYAALANNHILDCGVDGLEHTLCAMRAVEIEPFGAGLSRQNAAQPVVWEGQAGRVALLNWVFPETHPDCGLDYGANLWPGPGLAEKAVRAAAREADWVVAVLHWSDELFGYPRPEDRLTARHLADMGVTAVIGGHAHVVRGMERLGNCPVYYSLGNYYFDDLTDPALGITLREAPLNRSSLGVLLDFKPQQAPQEQVFSYWSQGRAVKEDGLRRAERRLRALSRPLLAHRGVDYAAWYAERRRSFDRWEYRWQFRLPQLGLGGVWRLLMGKILARTAAR